MIKALNLWRGLSIIGIFHSSEDCLRLNVWTPGLDSENRPVLVYFHGGGFFNGNAIEQDGYGEKIYHDMGTLWSAR